MCVKGVFFLSEKNLTIFNIFFISFNCKIINWEAKTDKCLSVRDPPFIVFEINKLCLIKIQLDILGFLFSSDFFQLWFLCNQIKVFRVPL